MKSLSFFRTRAAGFAVALTALFFTLPSGNASAQPERPDPTLGRVIATGTVTATSEEKVTSFPYAVISDYSRPGGFVVRVWGPDGEVSFFGITGAEGSELETGAHFYRNASGSAAEIDAVGEPLKGVDRRAEWADFALAGVVFRIDPDAGKLPFINQEVSGKFVSRFKADGQGGWVGWAYKRFDVTFTPEACTRDLGLIAETVEAIGTRFPDSDLTKVDPALVRGGEPEAEIASVGGH